METRVAGEAHYDGPMLTAPCCDCYNDYHSGNASSPNRQTMTATQCKFVLFVILLCSSARFVHADEPIEASIRKGVAVVEKAANNYPSHRKCFSCHHQTLPILAMVTASRHGVKLNREVADQQAKFTFESFHGRLDRMKEGTGIGGRAFTIAYGLWEFDLLERKPDETTSAMVTYLLKTQHKDGYWTPQSIRPPLEESRAMCTVLSSYYMDRFADKVQRDEADAAIATSRTWLADAPLKSQEDFNAKLWSTTLLGKADEDSAAKRDAARNSVLQGQREDGGWSQLTDMNSDAYATGQTLYVLLESGTPKDDKAVRRAVEFLSKTQQDDGSWLVETRSKPIQLYFDNGDPHGKSQFISIAATSWAIAALAESQAD